MSLFFEERMNEQKEDDPENDMNTFIYPFMVSIPLLNDPEEGRAITALCKMTTIYNIFSIVWQLRLTKYYFTTFCDDEFLWNATCNVSYSLFCDNEMRLELYSSPKVSTLCVPDEDGEKKFKTPDGFLTKFHDEFVNGKVAEVVFLVEIIIPAMTFYRPFDLYKFFRNKYPENLETDFRFEFMKESDYSIKCSDGYLVPALKMVLNVSSKFMHNHFKESKENELIVEHKIDVVKPIILYLHSLCFKMPKCYDLDFVDRLLKAVDFFEPEHRSADRSGIKDSIHKSLCQKFAAEKPSNFISILQWLRLSIHHRFYILLDMVCALISYKFYFKWIETFSEMTRDHPLFCDIFGYENYFGVGSLSHQTFYSISRGFVDSLFTNVILN
uniref:Uncharacterized protein n=1 Tax=Panagrolaimus davidi TaxID=227884 RepID=A0A914R185_9BILA